MASLSRRKKRVSTLLRIRREENPPSVPLITLDSAVFLVNGPILRGLAFGKTVVLIILILILITRKGPLLLRGRRLGGLSLGFLLVGGSGGLDSNLFTQPAKETREGLPISNLLELTKGVEEVNLPVIVKHVVTARHLRI